MIDSKIMIGNWIDSGDGYGQVTGILEDIQTTANNLWMPPECYYPIPLTDEVLGKCGFVKWKFPENYPYNEDDAYIWIPGAEDGKPSGYEIFRSEFLDVGLIQNRWYAVQEQINSDESSSVYPIGTSFQHLHQLQNLFYCLTQTELKIEL